MELVIEIPDKVYNRIKSDNGHGYCTLRDQDERVIVNAICNSIRLAKGHGDLIDRDKLSHIYRQMSYCSTAPNFIWVGELMKVEPVIKADKENDNEIDN